MGLKPQTCDWSHGMHHWENIRTTNYMKAHVIRRISTILGQTLLG